MLIPSRITAGDTVTWTEQALNGPDNKLISAPDYSLRFSFRGPVAVTGGDVDALTSGSGWELTLSSELTASMNTTAKAAQWNWQAYATKGGNRITVGSGVLKVAPNFSGLSGVVDCRTTAEQILANIEATLLARTTGGGVQEYTIGNRSMKYIPTTELLALKGRYQLIVSRERKAQRLKNGLGSPDRIGIRFRSS